jgi:hypothetical protein
MLFFWLFIAQRINPHLEALCNVELTKGDISSNSMLFFWPFIVQRINPHLEALCNVEVDEGRYLIEAHVVLLAFYSPEN